MRWQRRDKPAKNIVCLKNQNLHDISDIAPLPPSHPTLERQRLKTQSVRGERLQPPSRGAVDRTNNNIIIETAGVKIMAYRLERLAISACRRSRVVGQINKPSSSCTSSSQLRPIVSTAFDTVRQQQQPTVSTNSSWRNFHSTTRNQDDSNDGGAAVETAPFTSPKVEELFNKIIYLDMVEVHLLAELINEKMGLKISDAERERMARGGGGGGGGGKTGDDDEAAPAAEEKTIFDLKLTAFDAKAKIKVIKEVRAITSLGLKEAKELVEGAPSTVKKDIKMEEAEELKAKLEALGATVEIA